MRRLTLTLTLTLTLSVLVLSLVSSGCSFETQLEGLNFECSQELPCGEGFICDLGIGSCIAEGTEALPEICLESACSDEQALGCSPDGLDIQRCTRDAVAGCLVWSLEDSCSDEHDCTTDACSPTTFTCTSTLQENHCLIDTVCRSAGTKDVEGCRSCDPLTRTDAWVAVPNGATCQDLYACTVADICQEGFCIGGDAPDCDDDVVCTSDTCVEDEQLGYQCEHDLASGNCLMDSGAGPECLAAGSVSPDNPCMGCNPSESTAVYTANVKGTPCDDENVCTTGDTCSSGVCAGLGSLDCNDKLSCTTDTCDQGVEGGCVNAIEAGTCVIANQCWAQGDSKPGGDLCLGCFPDAGELGWTAAQNGASCDDGDLCSVSEVCNGGLCESGLPKDCSDGLSCTTDQCNVTTGGCESSLDSGVCLIEGTCELTGVLNVVGGCKTCDPGLTTAAWVPLAEETSCSDQNPCTLSDTCSEGVCLAGTPKDCADDLACTQDTCEPTTGACQSTLDGGHCEIDGACVIAGSLSPQNSCLACQPDKSETTYMLRESGSSCDDADVCTVNDACDGSGSCSGGQATVCDDGLACTTDACVSQDDKGCQSALDAGSCVIEAACVAAAQSSVPGGCLSCDPGATTDAWTAASCDDGLSCTEDLCGAETGTCENALADSTCFIEDECVGDGEQRPDNVCEICASSFKSDGWTPNWGAVCHAYPGGDAVCEAGVCQFSCPEPLADCDAQPGNGCEVDLSGDLLHCGECANLCTAGMACKDGECTADCGDLTKCGPYCADLDTSLEHCGGCDWVCGFPNAAALCSEGLCAIGGCQAGFVNVNLSTADGCECPLDGDEVCDGVDNDCDGEVDDVVEDLLLEDPMNCGICGEVCPGSDVTQLGVCVGGVCAQDFCPPDSWNLDGSPDNGCEYSCAYTAPIESCDGVDENCDGEIDEGLDLLTDTEHCGSCGVACEASALAQGVPDAVATWACVTGSCFVQKCVAGWVDKDQDHTNGCEHAFVPDGIFYVHWLDGNDFTANGSEEYPFQTIQGALDAVTSPDWTVLVAEGLYLGGIVIPAPLTGLHLLGSGMDVTIIESLDLATGITIEAQGVSVSDLRIEGGRVGILATGTWEAPLTGPTLERLSLDKMTQPNVCTESEACFEVIPIGVDLVHTQGAVVKLLNFLSIEGADGVLNSFWSPVRGQDAIGLRVSSSSGCQISANQVLGPLLGGLGSRVHEKRSHESGTGFAMSFSEVTDCEVSGNLVQGMTGQEGRSQGSTPWGFSTAGPGGAVVGFQIEGSSEGLVLSGNSVQSLTGGDGGSGTNGVAGGLAIGVKLQAAATGVTLESNVFVGLEGGSHWADGSSNPSYGVWVDDDSVANVISLTNTMEGVPIYYIYGAEDLTLEDLQLGGAGNPTNLGKLVIVASKNVTVMGGEFAHVRGQEGWSSSPYEQGATHGANATGILLRDCEQCAVIGADVHHVEGGRGGSEYSQPHYLGTWYTSQGPGTGGWAAGIRLEGTATSGCTLSGNTLHALSGGAAPPCLQDTCQYATEHRQGAMGIYLAEESLENEVDDTNLLDGQPIVYRYGAQDEVLEGYNLDRVTLGTNWGQIVVFNSQSVSLRDLTVSNFVGIQGTDTGWTTPAIHLDGCEDCALDGISVYDVEGGRSSAVGNCKVAHAGGAITGILLKDVTGMDARNLLLHDLRGGASGNADCESSGVDGTAYGVGGSANGIWTDSVDGTLQHVTITDLQGGLGESHLGTRSIRQDAQGEGQVLVLRNSILSGASIACVTNLETNAAGTLQLYNTGLHACGPDAETWHLNAALVSGNLLVDPLFESPSEDNYHLNSASPHIDAGFPDDGLCEGYTSEPAPNGCAPNMGFYGNTAEAATQAGADHCVCSVEE